MALHDRRSSRERVHKSVGVVQKDLVAEIHNAAAQVRPLAPSGVMLHVDCPVPVPDVFADGARLNQMIVHLLLNAMAHTPAGSVTVHASWRPAFGGEVRVQVADTGLGMSEREVEVRSHLNALRRWQRATVRAGWACCIRAWQLCLDVTCCRVLQRVLSRPAVKEAAADEDGSEAEPRSHPSFRLRLSRIKQLVELHGGSLHVVSRPGAGTSVNFTLPVFDATLHSSSCEPAARPQRIPAYGTTSMQDRCARWALTRAVHACAVAIPRRATPGEQHARCSRKQRGSVQLLRRGHSRNLTPSRLERNKTAHGYC